MNAMLLGAGAVGCWIGANLMRAGHRVTFVGRQQFVDVASTEGLRAHLPNGQLWHLAGVDAVSSVAEAMQHGPFDAAIVCVKAYSVDDAIRELHFADAQFTADTIRFVAFQNGVGSEEKFVQAFGAQRVIAATLTSPVSLDAPNAIRLEREGGGVGLSPLSAGEGLGVGRGFAAFAAALSRAPLLHVKTYTDYRAMKWSKLFLNIVGNATSAILDLSVAEIYADPRLFAVEMRMLRETLAVMRAQNISVVNLPGYRAASLARAVSLLPNAILQPLLKSRIAQGRGDKRPSFYYDIANRTDRSEVTCLNGAVADAGRRLGLPTPVNETLTRMLVDLVAGRATQSAEQLRHSIETLA
jgi:2-dehydropantoate 2-reductase